IGSSQPKDYHHTRPGCREVFRWLNAHRCPLADTLSEAAVSPTNASEPILTSVAARSLGASSCSSGGRAIAGPFLGRDRATYRPWDQGFTRSCAASATTMQSKVGASLV